jgi:hypothetical protein
MLREVRAPLQHRGELPRRCFLSPEIDLFVWTAASAAVHAFQLAYDKMGSERIVSWHSERGFHHFKVDDGRRLGTPIIESGGRIDAALALLQFKDVDAGLPPELSSFIAAKLEEIIPALVET